MTSTGGRSCSLTRREQLWPWGMEQRAGEGRLRGSREGLNLLQVDAQPEEDLTEPKLGRGPDQSSLCFKDQEAGREVRNTIKHPQALWGLLQPGELATEALNTGECVQLYQEGEGKPPLGHCHQPSALLMGQEG